MTPDELNYMDVLTYRARVLQAARERRGETIFNGSMEHAQIVVETLFKTATGPINILAGGFNNGVYGHGGTLDAVDEYLQRPDASIRATYDEGDLHRDAANANYFFNRFAGRKGVQLRRVTPGKLANYNYHFFVANPDGYRYEADRSGKAAVAAFGADHKLVSRLNGIFETFWKHSEELTVPLKSAPAS